MKRVWFNGELTAGAITLDPADRGLTLGDGLFETLLVLNRTALWANMHLARMEAGAKELGIGFSRDAIDDAIEGMLEGADESHHILRITLTRGASARSLGANGGVSSLLLTLESLDPGMMFQPVSLVTASVRRNPQSLTSRLKTISYIDNIAAAREAAAKGAEDALMLNVAGMAACSSIANLFLIRNKTLVTPGRDQGILTGVMRQALIAAAHQLGLETEERTVKPSELLKADGVFLTNSLRFIRPVKSLDQQPLSQPELSDLANALCEAARLQCGRDPRLI
jgi:branched-chain amino acid aminotransferase